MPTPPPSTTPGGPATPPSPPSGLWPRRTPFWPRSACWCRALRPDIPARRSCSPAARRPPSRRACTGAPGSGPCGPARSGPYRGRGGRRGVLPPRAGRPRTLHRKPGPGARRAGDLHRHARRALRQARHRRGTQGARARRGPLGRARRRRTYPGGRGDTGRALRAAGVAAPVLALGRGIAPGPGAGGAQKENEEPATLLAAPSGGGAKPSRRLAVFGGARRNLVAAGAGALLAAVLGTVVTLGATSDQQDPPSDKVRNGQSANEDDGNDGLDADVPADGSTNSPGGGPSDDPKKPDPVTPGASSSTGDASTPGGRPSSNASTPGGRPSSGRPTQPTSKPTPTKSTSPTPPGTPTATPSTTPPVTSSPSPSPSSGSESSASAPMTGSAAPRIPATHPSSDPVTTHHGPGPPRRPGPYSCHRLGRPQNSRSLSSSMPRSAL